jgi:hypothetical protein
MKKTDQTTKVSYKTYELLAILKNKYGSSHKWIIDQAVQEYYKRTKE